MARPRGIFYQLYVLIDIYSRFNPSWIISPVQDSALVADFIAGAIDRNGATPHTVHADRGTLMTSQTRLRAAGRPRGDQVALQAAGQ